MRGSGLFALPPGTDFARGLAQGLLARHAGEPPEALARVELWVNSARMLRRVQAALTESGARLLPRLRLITDLARSPSPGLPAATPALRRRLLLATEVAAHLAQTGAAPAHAVQGLADSLDALLSEMHGEGVAAAALAGLVEGDLAEHWRRALDLVLRVAHLAEQGGWQDEERRQRAIVSRLVANWKDQPPQHPILIAGSTGSRGTTRMLIKAVAALPQGAVVLPGFDHDLPPASWAALQGPVPGEDHPQYRYAALLAELGATAQDVGAWLAAPAPDPARNALISLALRPAPVTDGWLAEGPRLGDLRPATRGLTLIEAPDSRREALAIALVLRQAAEQGRRAALISPDRDLTRRVTAALDRWGILPDDSAGVPLPQTPPGRFLRQVAQLEGAQVAAEDLLALLKSPLTATGGGARGNHLRFTRDYELHLRRHGPPEPSVGALRLWAAKRSDPEAQAWAEWLAGLLSALPPREAGPLGPRIAALRRLAEALAAGPGGTVEASQLWLKEGGAECQRLLDQLAAHADAARPHDGADTRALLTVLLEGGMVRSPLVVNPNVAIWGTLEARVGGAELVVLGGLTEGVWPAAAPPDPWLSRPMRRAAGLLSPERAIGLSAHDFQQAAGAPEVVLTRPKRSEGADTVPSRWLNRLTNLLLGLPETQGPEALENMVARGERWLKLASALEAAPPPQPAPRPAPRPPLADRPKRLSVTDIATLIRDPYAIYARRVLRLEPLDPLRMEADARLRGTVLHRVIERAIASLGTGPVPADPAFLLDIAEQVLASEVAFPAARALWLARVRAFAPRFLADEAARRAEGWVPLKQEEKAEALLPGLDLALVARADRIDGRDKERRVIDYKSGTPPTRPQMDAFEKQLWLEAAMVEQGHFGAALRGSVRDVAYIQLGGKGETTTHPAGDVVAETWAKLLKLLADYARPEQGYTSRRAMEHDNDSSTYDQLARYGEWDMTQPPKPEDLT